MCVLVILNNALHLGFRVYNRLCYILPNLILIAGLIFLPMVFVPPRYYFPHFQMGLTEVERGEGICPKSHK